MDERRVFNVVPDFALGRDGVRARGVGSFGRVGDLDLKLELLRSVCDVVSVDCLDWASNKLGNAWQRVCQTAQNRG